MRIKALIIFVLMGCVAWSQQLDIAMFADTNKARIGEPIQVEILASALNDSNFEWPIFNDHLEDLEVLSESRVDTQEQGELNLYRMELSFTAWDSGYFLFGPFPFIEAGDTIWSEALYITIETLEEVGEEIMDLRPPVEMPLTFEEWIKRYGWWVLAGIVLIVGLFFLFKRLKNGEEDVHGPMKSKIPAYDEAVHSLQELKEKELWQSGEVKEYYLSLTYIFRRYLERDWRVDALEYTSFELNDEIMRRFPQEWMKHQLKETSEQADLAKFAKAKFVPEDHQRNFERAFAFIKEMHARKQREEKERKEEES